MRRYFKTYSITYLMPSPASVLAFGVLISPLVTDKSLADISGPKDATPVVLSETPRNSPSNLDVLPVTVASKRLVKAGALNGDTSGLLKKFYDRLAHVKDATSAGMLESAIEMMWHRSGSDTVDLLMTRSLTAVNNQDSELALKLLDSVTELAPNFTEGWNRKAYVHFSNKQYHAALQDLRQALALDPKHFKAMDGLANVLREIGDKKRALQIYRTLIKVHPFWPGAKEAIDELRREVDGQEI